MESFEKKEKLCLALEKALADETVDPIDLPLWFLEAITDDFSEEQQIGSGGFGSVYEGKLLNEVVAVKKLHNKFEIKEKDFEREIACLIDVKHRNIVRFLGYCYQMQRKMYPHKGRHVLADERNMLFCFEFLRNGSLANYVTGPSSGLQWVLHYQIIKGICEGVRYLHQEKRITHMDLKPDNILLDDSMVPKIADFGLSRRFSGNQSKIITENIVGSRGYTAPEFLETGKITFEVDIFSLGVIIVEMMGCKERPKNVDKVLESWTNKFGTSQSSPVLIKQVKLCAEIGIDCMHGDPSRRPGILDIIQKLKTDISVPQMGSSRFYPAKQAYKPMQNTAPVTQKALPQDSPAAASLLLEEQGHYTVPPRLLKAQGHYTPTPGSFQIIDTVPAYGGGVTSATVQHIQVMAMVGFGDIRTIDVHSTKPWILVGHGKFLSIWYYKKQAKTVSSFNINDKSAKLHRTIQVHARVISVIFIPQKEWFVAGDDVGFIRVYKCLSMEEINSFKATGSGSVRSLAIHPTKPFLLSACKANNGVIEIWDWTNGWACYRKVETGHRMPCATFNPMDAKTFVTSHRFDGLLMVWSIKGSSRQPIAAIGCRKDLLCHDHVFTEAAGRNHVVVVIDREAPQIWDLQTGTFVHTLRYDPRSFIYTAAACHPTLPLIVVGGHVDTEEEEEEDDDDDDEDDDDDDDDDDGRDAAAADYDDNDDDVHWPSTVVCFFWNSTNYRLEKTIRCTSRDRIIYLGFVGSRRLVIGTTSEIHVLEIDMESLASQQ